MLKGVPALVPSILLSAPALWRGMQVSFFGHIQVQDMENILQEHHFCLFDHLI